MENVLRKLTEEEKQKITYVLNDIFNEDLPDESSEDEYTTEYDILMKKKEEEFKLSLLQDNDSHQIEVLLDLCEKYIKRKAEPDGVTFSVEFTFLVIYDMWLNKSPGWPVMHNPEWENWNKLKEKS